MSNWSTSMRAEIFFTKTKLITTIFYKICLSIPTDPSATTSPLSSIAEKSPEAAVKSASLLGSTTPMLAVISPVYNLPSAVRKVFSGMSRSKKFGLPPDPSRGMLFFLFAGNLITGDFFWRTMVQKTLPFVKFENFPCIFQQSLKLGFYNQYYSFGSWLDQNPEISPLFLIVSVTSVVAHSHLTLPKGISFGIDYFATNNNFWDSTDSTCTFRDFSESWISHRFCK